jgi:hypothetical protein
MHDRAYDLYLVTEGGDVLPADGSERIGDGTCDVFVLARDQTAALDLAASYDRGEIEPGTVSCWWIAGQPTVDALRA